MADYPYPGQRRGGLIGTEEFPQNIRIFIGGFEVTSIVRRVKVNLDQNDVTTVNLELTALPIHFDDDCIFIGELPKDEFMAEMVRIKLKREGVMDEKRCDKNKA